MRIMARGHHIYRRYTAHLPEGGRMEVVDGATVGQVLAQLEIPAGERPPLLVFVNGRPAGPDRILKAEDELVFFSPLEGG